MAEQGLLAVEDALLDRPQDEGAQPLRAAIGAEEEIEQKAQLGRIVDRSARSDPLEQHALGVFGQLAVAALAPIEEVGQRLDVEFGPGRIVAPALAIEVKQKLGLLAADRAVLVDGAAQPQDVIGRDAAARPNLGFERGQRLRPATTHILALQFTRRGS